MKGREIARLVEDFLDESLSAGDRSRLIAWVDTDPEAKRQFIEQVMLARTMRVLLRQPTPPQLAAKVRAVIAGESDDKRLQLAAAVNLKLDAGGIRRGSHPPPGRRRSGRSRWAWPALFVGVGALAAAAAAGVIRARKEVGPAVLVERDDGTRAHNGPARAAVPRFAAAPPATAPPAPAVAAEVATRAPHEPDVAAGILGDRAHILHAEGPELARRPDVVFFMAFEAMPAANQWGIKSDRRLRYAELEEGFVGSALRVRFPQGPSWTTSVTRFDAQFSTLVSPPTGEDEAYLRYYIMMEPGFEFGRGGALPGLCGGSCFGGWRRLPDGRDRWAVLAAWGPDGELGFIAQLPAGNEKRLAQGWGRRLTPGKWHVLELRVRLNTPGASDGLVEGWLDGTKAASVSGIKFREVAGLQIDAVTFNVFFRQYQPRGGPPRELGVRFDNLVVARQYVGSGVRLPPETR
jgi:hypothetical protein